MKNTELGYMYRDADNYKVGRTVVFKGEIKSESIKTMLKEKMCEFVPSQVGLEDLQEELQAYDSEDYGVDHCFHEFTNLETTDKEPTDSRTIHEFVKEVLGTDFVEVEVGHILNSK